MPPIHPGETLREDFLKSLGLNGQPPCDRVAGASDSRERYRSGKRAITADTALRLARYFGTTPQFWMNLQANYDLERAQDERGMEIADRIRPHRIA